VTPLYHNAAEFATPAAKDSKKQRGLSFFRQRDLTNGKKPFTIYERTAAKAAKKEKEEPGIKKSLRNSKNSLRAATLWIFFAA